MSFSLQRMTHLPGNGGFSSFLILLIVAGSKKLILQLKPSFKLTTGGKSFDVHPKYLRTIHKADGYEYTS